MILTTTPRTSYYQQHDFLSLQQHFLDCTQHDSLISRDSGVGSNSKGVGLDVEYDFGLDKVYKSQSISPSPTSTQSLLSQLSSIQQTSLSALESVPGIATSPGTRQGSLFKLVEEAEQRSNLPGPSMVVSNHANPMHVEPWLHTGQLTPKSAGRLTSLSPASAGPASPYSQHTSNPQIAVTDTLGDSFHGVSTNEDFQYQISKSFPAGQDTFYANYPNYTFTAAVKPRLGPNRSRPLSVASSVASEPPATPAGEPEDDRRQKNVFGGIPKIERTMTDVYSDELYSPNFNVGSSSSGQMPVSPSNDLFAQRLQAANCQHLNATQSPISISPRDRSPFRNGSPLAPVPSHEFPTAVSSANMRYGSAQQLREQRKAAQDARTVQQQLERASKTSTPQTISPKDAVLDYHEPEGDANLPLFPRQGTTNFDANQLSRTIAQTHQPFDSLSLDESAFSSFVAPQLATTIQVPQQYPFVPGSQHSSSNTPMSNRSMAPSKLSSSELGNSDSVEPASPQRPAATNADGGTYTCTYHGCTLRFDTPVLLQKHKREGHRQVHGINGRRVDGSGAGMTSSLLNSQAGPHRCDRINPSTGKPCSTIFSRPYDLTRHEDTIHNARKQKVRCDLCTDEKTFSRADALTRHYRVCHPDVEFHGKHRRRGNHSA